MKIAVIQTRFPYIDRRALSEAWFSALRLGAPAGRPSKPLARAAAGLVPDVPRGSRSQRAVMSSACNDRATAPKRARDRDSENDVVLAARATHSSAGNARVAYEPEPSRPPFRTALTFDVGGGRVHLLLRREGNTLHVVALCRPELAEVVRRALLDAGAHLSAQGESVRAAVRTFAPGPVR
jgi:hypothetical protein